MKITTFLLSFISFLATGQTPVVWEKIVPETFRPETEQVQWADLLPDITLPKGKIWVGARGSWDPDFIYRKGVTHISKYELSNLPDEKVVALQKAGKTYDEVPITPTQLSLPDYGPDKSNWVPKDKKWPEVWNERFFGKIRADQTEPLTYQQGFEIGSRKSTDHALSIFENTEQDHALSSHWALWRGNYDGWIPHLKTEFYDKGIPYYVGHNYFSGLNPALDWLGGKEAAKSYVRNPTGSAMLPGGTLEKTNLSCFGLYLGPPDESNKFLYRLAFAGYANHVAKLNMVGFMAPNHEFLPNNYTSIKYPEGTMFKQTKIPVSPTDAMGLTAVSFIFGDGFVPWSFGGKKSSKNLQREYSAQDLWFPNGATTPQSHDSFPHWWEKGEVYYGYTGVEDYSAFAVHAVARTFFQVEGGAAKFIPFQIDDNDFGAVNYDADNVVNACYEKRGILYTKTLSNKTAILYINPYADNRNHILTFSINGKKYSGSVSTNAPWLLLITQ